MYDPEKDIPDLTGKVIFITGGTAGLGRQTINYLARHNPAEIHFTGRNAVAAAETIAEVDKTSPTVQLTFHECDQTSLASVNATASSFLAENPSRLDILICNAGRMGGPPGLTKDGYEIQFGINYLSHALLTKRLIPILHRTASTHGESRVINLTSQGYTMHTGGISFEDLRTTQENIGKAGKKWARYAQSKFAQVLYTSEFTRRYPEITAVAIHPGVVHTNLVEGLPLFDRFFIKLMTFGQSIPLEHGSYNTCWAATCTDMESGAVYYPVGVRQKHSEAASNQKLWKELWEWTDKQLELFN